MIRSPSGRFLDGAHERKWEVGAPVVQPSPLAARVGLPQLVERTPGDWEFAAHHVVEQHAKAVHVALYGLTFALEYFRSEIDRCPFDWRTVSNGAHQRRCAEVHQDDPAAGLAHDVLRLDVAVQEARLVDGPERLAQIEAQDRGFLGAVGALCLDDLFQRAAIDEFHPEADRPSGAVGTENPDHVGMIDAREKPRLVDGGVFIGEAPLVEKFQGNFSLENRFPGSNDRCEGPGADDAPDGQVAPRGRRLVCASKALRKIGHHAQLLDYRPVVQIARAQLGVGPIDVDPVGHRPSEGRQSLIIGVHIGTEDVSPSSQPRGRISFGIDRSVVIIGMVDVDVPMTENAVGNPLTPEATVELLALAKGGDGAALDRLLQRCLPALRRWARGRMPTSARGMLETADLVQDAVLSAMRHLNAFESRHQGALQAYLRQAVLNRIRDLARQQNRRPEQTAFPEHLASDETAADELVGRAEAWSRYEAALERLSPGEREAIILRLELQYEYSEIAVILGKSSDDAARMAVTRAMRRLAEEMRVH